jgi:hypothetical protein
LLSRFLDPARFQHRPTAESEVQLTSQTITLTLNGTSLEQNGSSGVIDIYQNEAVVYQTGMGSTPITQFSIQFTNDPYASAVNSPSGSAVTVQPNQGTAGNTYNYSSVTINNQQLSGVSPMGVRIRPGP